MSLPIMFDIFNWVHFNKFIKEKILSFFFASYEIFCDYVSPLNTYNMLNQNRIYI